MKLVFPHKEHKDFELIGDSFTIGSSDEAAIRIEAVGMSDIHATLVKEGSDYLLKIDNPACMASVNGRLVKKSKEIREGDLMIIAQVHCKLAGDNLEKPADDNRTMIRMALPKFVLRGVSGVYFGKTFPLRGKTNLGRHSENDIFVNVDGISRKHAAITVTATGLEVEDFDSSNGTFINGEKLEGKREIKIGDEIKLDNIRFLIQSPGAPLDNGSKKSHKNSQSTQKANPIQSIHENQRSGAGLKWGITILILVTAAIAGAWYMGYLDKFL